MESRCSRSAPVSAVTIAAELPKPVLWTSDIVQPRYWNGSGSVCSASCCDEALELFLIGFWSRAPTERFCE